MNNPTQLEDSFPVIVTDKAKTRTLGRTKKRNAATPWKLGVGAAILLLGCAWPILLVLVFGDGRNDFLHGLEWAVLTTGIVGLGLIVTMFESPVFTWLYVILLTGILPGIVAVAGWCSFLEGLGYEFHPWTGQKERYRPGQKG